MRPRRGSARPFSPLIVLSLILSLAVVPGVPAQAAPAMAAPRITEVYSRDGAVDVVFLPANQDRDPTGEWSMTVTAAPGGKTAVVKDRHRTSVRVTGLTNGTKYTFTAVENVAGTTSPRSVKSEPAVPHPARRPLPPTIDSVLGRDGSLVVHWNPGADRGAPITGYTVTASPSGKKVTVGGDARTATLTGLTNGKAQTVSVAATNKIGTGKAATHAGAVPKPAYAPTRPRAVSALPASDGAQGSLDVTWQPPRDDGGAPITSYTVTPSPSGKPVTVAGSQHQARLTGLDPEKVHTVSVTAANGVGERVSAAGTAQARPGYRIPDKTIRLTANSMDAISRIAHDRVVFNQATPQVKKLVKGQIIVAEARQPRPRKGLLREITEVRTSGEKVVLITRNAKLHEAIHTSSLRAAPKADWVRAAQVRSLTPGARVEAEPLHGSLDVSIAYKPQASTSEDTKVQAEGQAGFEAALTGEVTVTPDWSLDVDMSWFSVRSASVSAKADIRASLEGRFTAMFEGEAESKPLAEVSFGCTTFWIGWFPLVLCPRFTLVSRLNTEGSLEFTFTASYEQTIGGSITYSSDTGVWTPQDETTKAVNTFEPSLKAAAKIAVSLPANLSILLYDIAGPGLEVTPSLVFDADSSRTPWGRVTLVVDVSLTFKVPLLGLEASLSVYNNEDAPIELWTSGDKLTTVSVEPATSRVQAGGTVRFTAKAVGCANAQPITWTLAEGALGRIDTATGVYTAPATGSAHDRVIASQAASGGCSAASGHGYVHSGVVAPSAPRNLAFERKDGNIVLSWAPPADNGNEAVSYGVIICRTTDVHDPCTLQPAITETRYTFVPAPDGTDMPVRAGVIAHNSAGDGPPAEYISLL